jgi:zinc D-Ala-D-Ala carboxypeptidase
MISKHITLEEAINSPTALRLKIDNKPSDIVLESMKLVAEKCFEPLREWYGKPIKVNSFYRSLALNKAVGGSATSQHVKGEAIDLTGGSKEENKKIFDWCKANLVFDQLLWEYGDDNGPDWVHISYKVSMNRNQILVVK